MHLKLSRAWISGFKDAAKHGYLQRVRARGGPDTPPANASFTWEVTSEEPNYLRHCRTALFFGRKVRTLDGHSKQSDLGQPDPRIFLGPRTMGAKL